MSWLVLWAWNIFPILQVLGAVMLKLRFLRNVRRYSLSSRRTESYEYVIFHGRALLLCGNRWRLCLLTVGTNLIIRRGKLKYLVLWWYSRLFPRGTGFNVNKPPAVMTEVFHFLFICSKSGMLPFKKPQLFLYLLQSILYCAMYLFY
jgi:hypothetical protein